MHKLTYTGLWLSIILAACTAKYKTDVLAQAKELHNKAHELAYFNATEPDSLRAALVYLNEALQLAPEVPQPRTLRATVCRELGQYQNALADIDTLLQVTANQFDYHRLRANIYRHQGDTVKYKAEYLSVYQLALNQYGESNAFEDYLGTLAIKTYLIGKEPVYASLDSLKALHPEQDSVIQFTRMGVEALELME